MLLSLSIFASFVLFITYSFYKKNYDKKPTNLLFVSSILSFFILMFWFILGAPSFIMNFMWLSWGIQGFKVSLIIDFPFIMFSAVALFVTWSMMEFAEYYMSKDPKKKAFMKTLMLFLLFMLMLVSANNLFMLFIGWEGVGIMSFILISWWFTRSEAKSSALQAIMYNRMGDSGMIVFMAMAMLNFNTWNLQNIIFMKNKSFAMKLAMLGIILAAAGKSAQFSLHPWLPAAMEGPTPVSALLHSSTMVVAGVFLLFRCSPIFKNTPWALTLISMLGAITALFAASAALTQYDMKKIIAYSTTSQLGLMVVAIGMNVPKLALFHICTHAFFKALLFLCSGSIIHNLKNEQDMRKMGKSSNSLPLTSSCVIIASLALCGLPFLAGYYSKDLILEASQKKIGNSISIILAMIATWMTAIYSLRLIFYSSNPNINTSPINPISEEYTNLLNPMIRLTAGVFIAGWSISIFFMKKEPFMIPWLKKTAPLLMLMYSGIYMTNNFMPKPMSKILFQKISKFTSKNWFYVSIIHSNTLIGWFKASTLGVLRTLDQGWTSLAGASGISASVIIVTNVIQKAHKASISSYIKFFVLMSMMFTIIFLIF